MAKKCIVPLIVMFMAVSLSAEIIYLNDGQVLRGTIIREGKHFITVQTRFQTREVYRKHIKRIMYGERDMEPIYFLMRDGRLINGFLVDQDSRKVVYRKTKDSAEEFTLLKEDISQMSAKEITPLYPDIMLRVGVYAPLNSGGANLGPGVIVMAGYGINFSWIKNSRLLLEAGYAKCDSTSNEGQSMKIMPVMVSGLYSLPFPFTENEKLRLVPKAGAGIAVVDFEDGEGSQYRGYDFTATGGAGILYEVKKHVFTAGVWVEYNLLYEKSALLHGLILTGALQYFF
ncbi:MAG TPA: hypothetical protein PK544_14735 [Spirochaetota bacterium]|nr:hypothetical protein [Spirochaetota bacterium]